jgi:hypothetical protein
MNHCCSDLGAAFNGMGLSAERLKSIPAILEESRDIPRYMMLKLFSFLRAIRLERFVFLSTVEKTVLLENFLYLMRGRQKTNVSAICHLFLEESEPQTSPSSPLPRNVTEVLVELFKTKTPDPVREAAWRILEGREPRLASLLSPSQLIYALWSENPVFRNTMVKFLFRHFNTAEITSAIAAYTATTGKALPSAVLKRIIALGGSELEREKKKYLLTNLMKASDTKNKAIEEVWSDYLKGLTRFDLIRAYQAGTAERSWVDDLKKDCRNGSSQDPEGKPPRVASGFHARIAEIRKISAGLKLDGGKFTFRGSR